MINNRALKSILDFSALLLFMTSLAHAVTDAGGSPYRTNIRINPITLFMGVFNVDADFVVSDAFTLGPSIGILQGSTELTNNTVQISAWTFGARLNYFFSGDAFMGGWYAAPSFSLVPVSITEVVTSVRFSASQLSFAPGILIGYQFMWSGGINFNFGFGATYYSTPSKFTTKMDGSVSTKTTTTPSFAGVFPQVDLSFGWAF